jgi:hypothetical protein
MTDIDGLPVPAGRRIALIAHDAAPAPAPTTAGLAGPARAG